MRTFWKTKDVFAAMNTYQVWSTDFFDMEKYEESVCLLFNERISNKIFLENYSGKLLRKISLEEAKEIIKKAFRARGLEASDISFQNPYTKETNKEHVELMKANRRINGL